MSINILKLNIYCFLLFQIDCYVLIPLKILGDKSIQNILSFENRNEDDLSLILYNQISIGEPKQNAIIIISPDEYNFYMVTNQKNKNITDNTYYDFRMSKTNNINFDESKHNSNFVFMSEKIFFQDKDLNKKITQEIGVENINLILYLQKPTFTKNYNLSANVNSYIIVGLKLTEGFDKIEYSLNLIRQLKRKNATQNYKWFIDYNTTINNELKINSIYINSINMIIGVEPHEIYPNLYQEKNLKLINSKSFNGYINWGFYFNKIYSYQNNNIKNKILFELNNEFNMNNSNFQDYLIADIKQDFLFIKSPKIFFDSINKNFFYKLIQENKCFIKENKYLYFYCENQKDIEEYIKSNFQDIYFKNQELNYEFVLGNQDLFIKYNNKIIFLIISENNSKKWTFGIPFLSKYLLVYDYDHKVIGFYKKNKKKYIANGDNKIYNIIKILLIVILLLVCGVMGFLISKHIYGFNRKKRINELQENYKYEEKISKKQNENINDFNNNEKKERLIELKIENV